MLAASGGAGASTLCALLAAAIAEIAGAGGRWVAVLDAGAPARSPWPAWLCAGLDPALGEEGRDALAALSPGDGYPRSLVLRCASAIRGLDGVAVVTAGRDGQSDLPVGDRVNVPLDLDAVAAACAVAVLDLPLRPCPQAARRLRAYPQGALLAVSGAADGIAAGLRAVRAWDAAGLPPRRLTPVVATGAGGLSPRARARLALLEGHTQPARLVPVDPAIVRRGLAEALAAARIGAPTRAAVRELASSLNSVPAPAAPEPPFPRPAPQAAATAVPLGPAGQFAGIALAATAATAHPPARAAATGAATPTTEGICR